MVKAIVFFAACAFVFHLVMRLIPYPELEEYQGRSSGFAALDRNGLILRVFPSEDGVKREWASLDRIPKGVQRLFLRAEDRRFYLHPGVDIPSLVAAALRNRQAGRIVSGASTITMQLARLIRPRGQGFQRKVWEAFDALRLEARLSKKHGAVCFIPQCSRIITPGINAPDCQII